MADLRIDVAAEFTGKKAFKQADTAVQKLQKDVVKLGRGLGLALGSAALIRYSKDAVKAFAADEAAAIRLANAVDNLGLAYANPQITKFIKELEITAGVADDVLRPAFQALLTTTKDLGTSYKLLNDALSISRGSGVDLATVVQDLSNGYVGITRGLRKYNTGLSQAELKSKSFAEVLAILNGQFAGANQAYLDSYAYKLDVLTVAAENAKETIGGGLVNALAMAGGGSEVQDAVKAIDNVAKAINGITTAVGFAVGALTKLYKGLDFITTFGGLLGPNGKIVQKLNPSAIAQPLNKVAQTQIKSSTILAKATKNNTAELKKQAALKKAGTVFDLDQIQIVAALKGKISEEEKIRLQAQLALLNGNTDLAARLTNEILKAQDSTGNLSKFLSALPNAKNPFEYLDAYLSYIANKAAVVLTGSTAPSVPSTNASAAAMPTPSQMAASGSFSQLVSQGAGASGGFSPVVAAAMAPQVIELKITGDGDLTNSIAKNLMQQSLSTGNQTYVNRRTGGFE